MKKTMLFLILLLVISQWSLATVRFVSHQGSNTPPYLTWETAADSIMSAINISSFGDTIYVANGVYKEVVDMIDGLTLIGTGSDSCVIDTREFQIFPGYTIEVVDSCVLSNLGIYTSNNISGDGIVVIGGDNSIVEYCKIQESRYGIDINASYQNKPLIYKNLLLNITYGVTTAFAQAVIKENIIYPIEKGLYSQLNSSPTYINNTVICTQCYMGFDASLSYYSKLYNNLFYGKGSYGLWTYSDSIRNSLILGKNGNWDTGIIGWGADIRNNNIQNSQTGLRYISGGSPIVFQYNNMWSNSTNFQNITSDTTNIFSDPMFEDEDSLNFRLQMFSPLIDAGDPNILDKDGSRSDIGLFGGPYGENYKYVDLPPRIPVNFSATVDTNNILLKWNKNTEADFNHYNLYRDTTENFTADSTTFVASIPDTFYLHIIPAGVENLYFKLTSIDNQGNQSEPSEELHIILTGIINNGQLTISNYQLYQNYPNPFNPSTRIGYRLKERGYVKLYVYDIKGELIETLVNKYQEGGYYEVDFNVGQDSSPDIASGVYVYQIMVRNEQNIPVFTDINKMIYLK